MADNTHTRSTLKDNILWQKTSSQQCTYSLVSGRRTPKGKTAHEVPNSCLHLQHRFTYAALGMRQDAQQACLCPCGQASASQSAPSSPSPGGTQSSRPHVICGPITRAKPGAAALQCVMPPPSPPAGSPHLLLHHRRPAGWEMFPGSEKNMRVSPGANTPALQRAQ